MRWWVGFLALGVAGVACTDKSEDEDTSDSGDTAGPGYDEARLAATEAAITGYESWSQTANWTGVLPSEDNTHGAYVQIWFNPESFSTISAGAGGDMPVGATVVKRGYDDAAGTGLRNLTVMHKDDQGWFWASWNNNSELLLAGEPDFCVNCHAAGQDSVRAETW